MRAPRNSVLSQIVAVAWVRGYVDHITVRAIAQCESSAAGPRVSGAIKRGHLVELPGHKPKRWGLTAERLDAINSMPDRHNLLMLAEQTAQRVVRIARIQAAERDERAAERRAALARAKDAATRQPTGAQRPPMLPGSKLVVPPPAGVPAGVVLRDQAQQPAQDPKGLLAPKPRLVAPPAPILLRGGVLAPADGPYIRPGALASLALPSRRADSLVPHRPPLSQP
jgi:hypothetical protein